MPSVEFKSKIISRTLNKTRVESTIHAEKPKSNTQQFCELYAQEILTDHEVNSSRKDDFLKNHEVDPTLRARMLDWMV